MIFGSMAMTAAEQWASGEDLVADLWYLFSQCLFTNTTSSSSRGSKVPNQLSSTLRLKPPQSLSGSQPESGPLSDRGSEELDEPVTSHTQEAAIRQRRTKKPNR